MIGIVGAIFLVLVSILGIFITIATVINDINDTADRDSRTIIKISYIIAFIILLATLWLLGYATGKGLHLHQL